MFADLDFSSKISTQVQHEPNKQLLFSLSHKHIVSSDLAEADTGEYVHLYVAY